MWIDTEGNEVPEPSDRAEAERVGLMEIPDDEMKAFRLKRAREEREAAEQAEKFRVAAQVADEERADPGSHQIVYTNGQPASVPVSAVAEITKPAESESDRKESEQPDKQKQQQQQQQEQEQESEQHESDTAHEPQESEQESEQEQDPDEARRDTKPIMLHGRVDRTRERHMRFIKVAEGRMARVLRDVKLLTHLASPYYVYTTEDAHEIVDGLAKAMQEVADALFTPKQTVEGGFRLHSHDEFAQELDKTPSIPAAIAAASEEAEAVEAEAKKSRRGRRKKSASAS